jgi:mxaJ protein
MRGMIERLLRKAPLQRGTRRLPLGPLLPAALLAASVWLFGALALAAQAQDQRVLRVCADPNNLPFSNRRLEGFENRIAELVTEELDATVEYTWWAQRRGFLRNTLYAGRCDVVMGIPSSHELVLATRAYYRSTYVFLYRADSGIAVESFDDPALRKLSIGVHLIGDDGTNSPPAHALTRRQIIDNVVGYMIYDDYAKENPPARLVEAVAAGDVDVAAVWGPLAGYFAPRQAVDIVITPVSPMIDIPALPFIYSISMGVRLDDMALKAELDEILHRRREDIREILDDYGVPRR